VEKERVEQDLRQATIAHRRLAQTFQQVVATKRKMEAQLKKEQKQQQQKQEQEEEEKRQQGLAESTASATTTASAAPSCATIHDQEAARASFLAQGLQEELARREADLVNLHAKLKQQGQARRTQLKEWEVELQEKEERVRRVAEKLQKEREHLRVCQERAQRKGRTRQAPSKSPRRSLSSSPLRLRRVQAAAEIQSQANRHAPALPPVVENQEQQHQLLSTLLLLVKRGGSLSIVNSFAERREGKDEEDMERREPVAAVSAALVQWEEAPRRRHWPRYSTSSSAVDGKEEERDVALDSTLPVSVNGADDGDGLDEQKERYRGVGRTIEEEGIGQEENRLFWTLDKVIAAEPGHGNGSGHDFIEGATVSRAAVAPSHISSALLTPPAIPQLPPPMYVFVTTSLCSFSHRPFFISPLCPAHKYADAAGHSKRKWPPPSTKSRQPSSESPRRVRLQRRIVATAVAASPCRRQEPHRQSLLLPSAERRRRRMGWDQRS